MDPISIVAGGVAFTTAIKDIISLGLKLHECLQNGKKNMSELGMLSQELVSDMYRLQAFYEDVSAIDSSQSDQLLYELDGVKLRLERILKKCQNLALGKSMGFLPLLPEWNFRRMLENELPWLRRQVDKIRLHFVFHSNIRLERALLVKPTEHSALIHRSQTALAALLSEPDSEYCQSIVTEMENDFQKGAQNSVGFQYLKHHIISLWKMAEGRLSNASTMTVRPRWDPHSSDPVYLNYSSSSIEGLSQEVLSLFFGLSSGSCSDARQLLAGLSAIATHITQLRLRHLFPQFMGRVEDTAKQVALHQRGFTVDHAYFMFLLAQDFHNSDDPEAACTWSEGALKILHNARRKGLWKGETTSHLSASLHLLLGWNCLQSPPWLIQAESHLIKAQKISRRLEDSSSPDFLVPSIVHHDWLEATINLIEYHQKVKQPQQALCQIIEGLSYFLHTDIQDFDVYIQIRLHSFSCQILETLNIFQGHDISLTAVQKLLSLSKRLSEALPDIFSHLFLRLNFYDTIATYFHAQNSKGPSDQQLRLMQAVLGARLSDADSRSLDGHLRRALSLSLELRGEDYVFDIFFAYLFSSWILGISTSVGGQFFFLDIITQLAMSLPALMQRAIAESVQWYTNPALNISSFRLKAIIGTLVRNISSLPFKPNALTTSSILHTLLPLLPKFQIGTLFPLLIDMGDIEGARALIFDPKSQWPSEADRTAYKFICARIVLQPDSVSFALKYAKSHGVISMTEKIEFLASHHQLGESFHSIQRPPPGFPEDIFHIHRAIIWCHAGKFKRAKKIFSQAGSFSVSWPEHFWLERFYAGLIHYHLHQFNEGLEVMQDITDEVRLWSPNSYPYRLRHHGRARLFQIYAALLASVNRLPEALDAANEATRSYRSIVSWGPGYGPFFAQSLETYAQILERFEASSNEAVSTDEETQNPTSVEIRTEAVDVWRGLVEKDEFFSMAFVDSMEVYREKLGQARRGEECERIGKEIEQWRERAEKVRREKNKDIEELEKAWKEAYPDWTDDMDDGEEFFSADEGDSVEDVQEFFSADEGESGNTEEL